MFILSAMQAQQFQEMINRLDTEQRIINARVCSASHLARRVVYELDRFYAPSDEHQIIHVFDEDGEIREYFIRFVDTAHLGVVPYLLTPVAKDNARVHLIFRGVQDAPAWCRSTEVPAPGCSSFYAERYAILNSLADAFEHLQQNACHLFISGHSLGGSDAQTCATELMQVLVERHKYPNKFQEYAALDKIKCLTVNHANSGGVQASVAESCKTSAEYLASHKLLKIHLMCILTAGDAVQQTGQSHILADATPDVAIVELVKLQSEYEGLVNKKYVIPALLTLPVTYLGCVAYAALVARNAYAAHKQRFFDNEDFKKQSFKICDNNTEAGRDKILSKLSKHPFDHPAMHQIMYYFNWLQQRYTSTKRISGDQQFVIIGVEDYADMPQVEPQIETAEKLEPRCRIS